MKRRRFVSWVSATAAGWPLLALSQRSSIPFVGFLNSGSPNEREGMVEAFRAGLEEGGFADGKDVAIEYRWAEGRFDRLSHLATELVERHVAVIATSGGPMPAIAAKSATKTIPIVFLATTDPVKLGLVESFGRPHGNVTGVTSILATVEAKRIQTMLELLPKAKTIAYLTNPNIAQKQREEVQKEIQVVAKASAITVATVYAGKEQELEPAFAAAHKARANALVVATDAFFTSRRERLVSLAERHAIPASYHRREFVAAGGLMSYGAHYADMYRQQGLYAARILKGAKPSDLPVVQASKFELVLNLKTARNLHINVPDAFLARANELIQ